ncbi:DUF4280 domain-containing protein [Apibacter muscae]|uniref:DUF4280 domain-containing protein n=1 Tax=Apibacter muscae TaxID=2509004 RepID=UPI0011ADE061|nr:DUF4280 domain-containing protein [Apibacter muscae]TWP22476.1 DUF4280 domain-containing protein [Apibacter muscae]
MSRKYFVCQGAVCQCNFGSTTDKLKVKTHTSVYLNEEQGNKKPAATTKELGQTFQNNSFGSCSKKNNNPCTVNVTQWKDYKDNQKIVENDSWLLLEDSTATCPIGGSGCIRIIHHGQVTDVHSHHFEKSDETVLQQLMPLTDTNEITNDTEDWVE